MGGCVRDSLLGRASSDIDIALERARVREAARKLAARLHTTAFIIDEENTVWRISGKTPQCQIDIAALQGGISADLARRDFTINALAYPVGSPCRITAAEPAPGGVFLEKPEKRFLLDNFGGLQDIEKKRIAAVSKTVFEQDPLRLLRAYRIAGELGFSVAPKTLRLIREHHALITGVSGERVRDELVRLLALPRVRARLAALDRARLLTALFPELEKQKGCAPQYYGGRGVFSHTLAVCDRLEHLQNNLENIFPDFHGELAAHAGGRGLLQLVALLHDISKPETARVIGGRLRFFHHEARGARRAESIMRALRFSRAETNLASKIISEHLRPGNLSFNKVITPRAVYRFFSELRDAAVPLLLVCWADYASYIPLKTTLKILPRTRELPAPAAPAALPGKGVKKTLRHMQVIHLMLSTFFKNPKAVLPEKLVSGHDLISGLGMPPGPAMGKLLEAIRLAQAEGKVTGRAQALALAARLYKKTGY